MGFSSVDRRTTRRIAFQGDLGAYSHQACREVYPELEPDALRDLRGGARGGEASREADLAMMPIENSTYGRVADLHHLLPTSGPLHHRRALRAGAPAAARACPARRSTGVKEAQSHTVALGQCKAFLAKLGIRAATGADTAGSAAQVAEEADPARAAIASRLAGEIYGLEVLAENIEDAAHNTTRFLVMSRQKIEADPTEGQAMTSFVFEVRNVPAALYKAMGGFATNGINMVKLECYMLGGSFWATQFYAEIEGHPDQRGVQHAFEELGFFTKHFKVLGVFPAAPFRRRARVGED